MYPKIHLYSSYKKDNYSSGKLFDVTMKTTLEKINIASNLCDKRNSFIDVGIGGGHNSVALSYLFKKGTMVEIEFHEFYNQILNKYKNLVLFNDKFENLPKTDKYDFILLADIYEHIPNIDEFVNKLSLIQDKGSVVYIMTPNPHLCGPAPESVFFYERHPYGHIKHYLKEEIILAMSKYGYALIDHNFEESKIRRRFKNYTKGIIRRDDKYQRFYFYRILRKIILFKLLKIVMLSIEHFVYYFEKTNKNNRMNCITQNLTFKKIN